MSDARISSGPPGSARALRLAGMLAAAVAACLMGLVALAGPASAHATVARSDPADQAKLPTSPASVTIWYSEAVSPNAGGMTVVNQKGDAVQTGVSQPSPDSLSAALPPGLPDGTYVATYRIISEDGHPISGSLVFGVGNAELADVSALAPPSDAGWDVVSKIGQFVVYLGALAAAGIVFFLAFVHDRGAERRRLGAGVFIGFGIALVGMAVVLVAHAAHAVGQGAGSILDTSKLGSVLGNGLGLQDGAVIVGLVLCVVSSGAVRGSESKVLAGLATVLATAPFVLWGHANEGSVRWISIPADGVHLVVAAIWFGGLIGLFTVLRARGSGPVPSSVGAAAAVVDAAPVQELSSTTNIVRRFSGVAFVSLVALTVAGILVALTLSPIGEMLSSTWGKLLLAKLLVVGAVAAAAGYNRYKLLPWLLGDSPTEATPDEIRGGWKTLTSTVRFEALVIVGVLALTAVLVNSTPGSKGAPAAPSGPFAQTQTFTGGSAALSIEPNRPGQNGMHVDLKGPDGKPLDVQAVQVELTLESKGIGPITRDLTHGGPGHYMLEQETRDLSVAGDWKINILVRIDDFDEEHVAFTDTVN